MQKWRTENGNEVNNNVAGRDIMGGSNLAVVREKKAGGWLASIPF